MDSARDIQLSNVGGISGPPHENCRGESSCFLKKKDEKKAALIIILNDISFGYVICIFVYILHSPREKMQKHGEFLILHRR